MTTRWWFRQLSRLARLCARDDGFVLLEYALTLALLAVASIAILGALGVDLFNLLDQSSSRMSTVRNP